jgi:phenylpropionate dioxygenase-like ring-hydroxylating dioxygenase large terminal subunit
VPLGGLPEAVIEFGPHVHRQWFAVALSRTVTQKPLRVFLLGWPFVLARLASGAVAALEDRCPHRGVPLSDGQVIPAGLSCRFHGWTFDQSGRCTLMPGTEHAESVAEIRVPSLFVIERDGLVWVGHSMSPALPERVLAMRGEDLRFIWQTKWACPAMEAQERFLDALRGPAIQPVLFRRQRPPADASLEVTMLGDGFRVDYGAQAAQSVHRRAYLSSLSTAQLEYRHSNGRGIWVTVCFTPETLVSTQLVGTLHSHGGWVPSWRVKALIRSVLELIASLELRTVESEDGPAVMMRGLIRPYLEETWSGAQRESTAAG